jgi:hypothetical protein
LTTEQLCQQLQPIFVDDSHAIAIAVLPDHKSSKSDLPLPERLLSVLIDACLKVELTSDSTDFHIEVLNMLLVLFSTQMYEGGQESNLFVDLLFSKAFVGSLAPLCQRFLADYIVRAPVSVLSPMARSNPQKSWFSYISSSVMNMFLWPFQIYRVLFTKKEANCLVSDSAAYLILILTHQEGDKSAFRDALSAIADADNDLLQQGFGLVSFDRLFEVLGFPRCFFGK